MKRILAFLCSAMILCSCVTGFAKEKTVLDFDADFFDFLPWNVETGEWKDGRDKNDKSVIEGENPEKERQEENELSEKKEKQKGNEEVKSIDLIVILDKSGSMYQMTEDTIGGFNSLLEEQRKKNIPVKVSLGMFNQVLDVKYNRVDLKEIKDLGKEDYIPQGTTALMDAVGNTLSALKIKEEVNVKGNKVLIVIITDGMENASKEWNKEAVKQLIGELQEKGYEFVFLGADIDASSVAQGIGIKKESSMKFKKTGEGVQANFKAMSVMLDSVSQGNSILSDMKWKRSIVEDK